MKATDIHSLLLSGSDIWCPAEETLLIGAEDGYIQFCYMDAGDEAFDRAAKEEGDEFFYEVYAARENRRLYLISEADSREEPDEEVCVMCERLAEHECLEVTTCELAVQAAKTVRR